MKSDALSVELFEDDLFSCDPVDSFYIDSMGTDVLLLSRLRLSSYNFDLYTWSRKLKASAFTSQFPQTMSNYHKRRRNCAVSRRNVSSFAHFGAFA